MISMSASSLQYIRYAVKATVNGNPDYNPTSDTVEFGFTPSPSAVPASDAWIDGSWETDPGPVYVARCLVGPDGDATLAVGVYSVWVRITDSPEIPIRQPGQLKIY